MQITAMDHLHVEAIFTRVLCYGIRIKFFYISFKTAVQM